MDPIALKSILNFDNSSNIPVLVSSIGNDKVTWHCLIVSHISTSQSNGGGSPSWHQRKATRHVCREESGVLSSMYFLDI